MLVAEDLLTSFRKSLQDRGMAPHEIDQVLADVEHRVGQRVLDRLSNRQPPA
jgi:hypothetical protein